MTEDAAALRRWMISGPEIARVVTEFEETFMKSKTENVRHHEQSPGVQYCFAKDVKALVDTIEEMRNPFLEDSMDLLVLDNKDIMPGIVVESVKNAQQIGQSQYEEYTKQIPERLFQACDRHNSQKQPFSFWNSFPKVSIKSPTATCFL